MKNILWDSRVKRAGTKSGRLLINLLCLVLLYGIAFTILYPFLFMLVSAFRGEEDLYNPSVIWITRHFTFDNIRYIVDFMEYNKTLLYTALITLGSTVLQVFVCGFAGYGFARFSFKGKGLLFALVIFTLIVPVQTYINPLYMEFRYFQIPGISQLLGLINPAWGSANLINTPYLFWIQAAFGMGIRSGLFIFLYRQFFRSMPKELEDAAYIDGCGPYRTYFKIMLPNATAIMTTVVLFSIVWYMNDYFSQSVLSTTSQTIAVSLERMRNVVANNAEGGNMVLNQMRVQAGALMSVFPLLLLFVFTQKYFTQSAERSGIVG